MYQFEHFGTISPGELLQIACELGNISDSSDILIISVAAASRLFHGGCIRSFFISFHMIDSRNVQYICQEEISDFGREKTASWTSLHLIELRLPAAHAQAHVPILLLRQPPIFVLKPSQFFVFELGEPF